MAGHRLGALEGGAGTFPPFQCVPAPPPPTPILTIVQANRRGEGGGVKDCPRPPPPLCSVLSPLCQGCVEGRALFWGSLRRSLRSSRRSIFRDCSTGPCSHSIPMPGATSGTCGTLATPWGPCPSRSTWTAMTCAWSGWVCLGPGGCGRGRGVGLRDGSRGCHKDAHPPPPPFFFHYGIHSLMFGGYPPTAIGYPPTAIGYTPTAIDYPLTAIGYTPTAIDYPPTAIGYTPTAIDYPPTAIGYTPTAIDYPPTAIGYTPTAIDYPPTAIGYTPTAIDYPPAAIGYTPIAIGYPPTAIGYTPAAIVGRFGHSECFFLLLRHPLDGRGGAGSSPVPRCRRRDRGRQAPGPVHRVPPHPKQHPMTR